MGRYSGKTCRLSTMLILTAMFFFVEIIVGYVTNSIALVADSFHMVSDVIALCVGFASVRIAKWPSKRNTYGWVRAEVLGAFVNAVFIVALCFSIVVEALKRLLEVEKVDNPKLLLFVGGAGLMVNVIGLFLFGGHGHSHGGGGHGHSHGGGHGHAHGGHDHLDESHDHGHHSHANGGNHVAGATESEKLVSRHAEPSVDMEIDPKAQDRKIYVDPREQEIYISSGNNISVEYKKPVPASTPHLSMRGVFLHVLGDALGSVVVVVSALVIWFVEGDWKYYIDPAMSLIMVAIILTGAIPLLKESAFILLQTAPSHVDVDNIIAELEQMEGIYGVHECHIWQLAGSRIVASAHIRCRGIEEYMTLAAKIKQLFHKAGIHSTTIQPEFVDWQNSADMDQQCALVCESAGQLCTPNTCCGHKEEARLKRLSGDGNKSNNSSCVDEEEEDGGEPEAGHSHLHLGDSRVGGHGSGSVLFTSAHSPEVDGEDVVLELSDLVAIEGNAKVK